MDNLRMKNLRHFTGLTQSEVAIDLGVNKQTVHRWESGHSKIKRLVEGAFITLVNNVERIAWIKANRPKRVRGRPFQKKIC